MTDPINNKPINPISIQVENAHNLIKNDRLENQFDFLVSFLIPFYMTSIIIINFTVTLIDKADELSKDLGARILRLFTSCVTALREAKQDVKNLIGSLFAKPEVRANEVEMRELPKTLQG